MTFASPFQTVSYMPSLIFLPSWDMKIYWIPLWKWLCVKSLAMCLFFLDRCRKQSKTSICVNYKKYSMCKCYDFLALRPECRMFYILFNIPSLLSVNTSQFLKTVDGLDCCSGQRVSLFTSCLSSLTRRVMVSDWYKYIVKWSVAC